MSGECFWALTTCVCALGGVWTIVALFVRLQGLHITRQIDSLTCATTVMGLRDNASQHVESVAHLGWPTHHDRLATHSLGNIFALPALYTTSGASQETPGPCSTSNGRRS